MQGRSLMRACYRHLAGDHWADFCWAQGEGQQHLGMQLSLPHCARRRQQQKLAPMQPCETTEMWLAVEQTLGPGLGPER